MSTPLLVVMIAALTMLGLNALLAWAFVWRYRRVNWRKYPEGRHLMRFTFVLAVIFTLTFVLNLATVPPMVGASVSLVLFTASAVELGNRLRLERNAQRDLNPSTKETSMKNLKPYAKAVVGFITPGVVALVAAVQDGSPGGGSITGPEWVGIGAACILTGSAVFGVENKPATDESTV